MTKYSGEETPLSQPGVDLGLPTGVTQKPRRPKRFQILALSGGGYRGLYSAALLVHAEEHFKCKIGPKFDLIAGTSIGALLAACVALEVPASDIVTKITKHGPKIFDRTKLVTWTKRTFFTAPYSPKVLENAIVDAIGRANCDTSLRTLAKPLAIVAVNYTTGSPYIFRSKGLAGREATDATILQAVLSSAAAPTYFPPQKVNDQILIDGGVIANAPEMLAISEATGTLGMPMKDLYVLAVGTASRRLGSAIDSPGKPSAASWLLRRQLFQSTLSAQEVLAEVQCRTLLKDRYYRINREPSESQAHSIRDFDLATSESTRTLKTLARESWDDHQTNPSFRSFLLD